MKGGARGGKGQSGWPACDNIVQSLFIVSCGRHAISKADQPYKIDIEDKCTLSFPPAVSVPS